MDNRRWMKNGENSLQGTLSQTSYNLLIIVIQYYKQSKTVYKMKGPSWSWSYGSWIYNYLCNRCLSPLTLWFRIPLRWVVLDTTLCDKVYRWFAIGLWFSPGTLVSFTNNTDHNDITEILLKVALNTITLTLTINLFKVFPKENVNYVGFMIKVPDLKLTSTTFYHFVIWLFLPRVALMRKKKLVQTSIFVCKCLNVKFSIISWYNLIYST